ncbi:MAG: RecQ family ATP-dependent DNA helicase [Acidobacteriaceae bacterium]
MSSIDEVLQSDFRLREFRPHQREIIEDVLGGHDVVCVMPTGAGKSLCFQLPAVVLRGLTVVMSPLISLMADQVAQLKSLNIPAAFLNGSQNAEEQRNVLDKLERGARGLLYIAPERLSAPSFQRLVPRLKPRLLVVDEAHCVSFWGHDFRPEYMRIAELREQLGSPVTMALTATATPQVRQDIVAMLKLRAPKMHVTGFDRPNLTYSCHAISSEVEKDAMLTRFLSRQSGSGIVYCSTRKAVEQLEALLEKQFPKRKVCGYHAGMPQGARQKNQQQFMDAADSIAVATNAFGMGINKPGIRFVLHYNLPGSVEAYYQEAGRAGRDGDPAQCVLYHGMRDLMTHKFFIRNIGDNNEALSDAEIVRLQGLAQRKLDLMYQYATRQRCRRRQILDYFGEATAVKGCTCDVCAGGGQPASDKNFVAPWMKHEASGRKQQPALSTRSPERKRRRDRPVRNNSEPDEKPLDSGAQVRFDQLRQVRLQLAKEQSVPAFCILPNKALREIARLAPQSNAELAAIKGMGAIKIEKFGAALLAAFPSPGHALRENQRETAPPRQTIPRAREARVYASPPPSTRPVEDEVVLDHNAAARFERLKAARTELATKNNWPPYFVLNDSALLEVAAAAPTSIAALAEVKGVGVHKASKWGSALLDALART